MTDTKIQIELCAFSYHREPFRHTYKNGLEHYIFRLQTEGSCEALIHGKMQPITPGDLLLFRPGNIYDLNIAGERNGMASGDYYVICSGSWLDQWWGKRDRPIKTKISEFERMQAIWHQLVLERRRLDDNHSPLSVLLLQALCTLMDRAIDEAPTHTSSTAFLAYKMKYYVEEHATTPFKLEDVARHVGLSVSRTVHLFKSHFECSIMQYVQKIRLSMAINLMKSSSITLEQIAEEAGFGSYTYFHRVFREFYGVPPGIYRKGE